MTRRTKARVHVELSNADTGQDNGPLVRRALLAGLVYAIAACAFTWPLARHPFTLFGAADNMGTTGACVLEPQLAQGTDPGALFPANWLRPRFRWQPLAGENLWEVRGKAGARADRGWRK